MNRRMAQRFLLGRPFLFQPRTAAHTSNSLRRLHATTVLQVQFFGVEASAFSATEDSCAAPPAEGAPAIGPVATRFFVGLAALAACAVAGDSVHRACMLSRSAGWYPQFFVSKRSSS